jgi:flagellar biosynthesis regulator FlaF
MNDYENLEKLLEQSKMDDYMMYTKEDLIDFGVWVVRECAEVANEHNTEAEGITLGVGRVIKKHFGVE